MKKERKGYKVWNIINKILLQHIGPVLNFNLEFPFYPRTETSKFSFVDDWLLHLSRNGIKDLTLQCFTRKPYTLPSHIYSASELVVLNLTKFIFKSPNWSGYFRKLTTLNFRSINFGSSSVTSPLNTPQLTHLMFDSCTEVCNFKICAPNLKRLILYATGDIDLIGFEMPKITTIALVGYCEKIRLTEIFTRWCLISSLYVGGPSLKYLVSDVEMESVPLKTPCLKHIVIKGIEWDDLHQISCILYLLRYSTALTRLEISAAPFPDIKEPTNKVSNYLAASSEMNWMINCLEIVIIDTTRGSDDETRFIKFLLSFAPKLKKMFIEERKSSGDVNAILKHLIRLPRVSKEAEIIFKPNIKVTEIPKVSSIS